MKLFVENNTKGRKCDYPISMKMLEEVKDVYFITETWCKENIYKTTCHFDVNNCVVESRKRNQKRAF